jgi:hypothetical protein
MKELNASNENFTVMKIKMTLKKKMMEEYVKGIIKENNKKQQNLY